MTATMEKTIENYERRIIGIPETSPRPKLFQMAVHENGSEICIHIWNMTLSGKWSAPTMQVTEEIHRQNYDAGGFYLAPDEME